MEVNKMRVLDKFFKATNITNPTLQDAISMALVALAILLIPLFAMLVSSEMDWDETDFIMVFILLFTAGFVYKLLSRGMKSTTYRLAIGLAIGTGFFLFMSNLAVGIVGSDDNSFNALYLLVLAVLFLGLIISRYKPLGMSWALFATALAQLAVTIFAYITGQQHAPGSSVYEIVAVNGFFLVLWLASGVLFRQAAKRSVII